MFLFRALKQPGFETRSQTPIPGVSIGGSGFPLKAPGASGGTISEVFHGISMGASERREPSEPNAKLKRGTSP